jgi:hypothetical protein
MTITTRFGRKLRVPSTFQIKHQLLLFWLKEQLAKETAEREAIERVASRDEASIANDTIRPTQFTPPLAATKTSLPLPAKRTELSASPMN